MTGITAPIRRRSSPPAVPLPPGLIEAAPLTLTCRVCQTPRCARPDRTVLWHQVMKDRALIDCPGAGMPGGGGRDGGDPS